MIAPLAHPFRSPASPRGERRPVRPVLQKAVSEATGGPVAGLAPSRTADSRCQAGAAGSVPERGAGSVPEREPARRAARARWSAGGRPGAVAFVERHDPDRHAAPGRDGEGEGVEAGERHHLEAGRERGAGEGAVGARRGRAGRALKSSSAPRRRDRRRRGGARAVGDHRDAVDPPEPARAGSVPERRTRASRGAVERSGLDRTEHVAAGRDRGVGEGAVQDNSDAGRMVANASRPPPVATSSTRAHAAAKPSTVRRGAMRARGPSPSQP